MRLRRLFPVFAAVTLAAQTPGSPYELLTQARMRILRAVDALPRYTCIQTLDRTYYRRAFPWRTCSGAQPEEPGTLEPEGTDRLRLDVGITSAGREIYSWTGGERFESERIQDVIGTGPIGTGSFGPFLIDIFGNRGVRFTDEGSETVDGRSLQKFAYRVPKESSHYDFQTAGENHIVAYGGMLWLDKGSAELVRLQVHTASMPHHTGTCDATTTMDFETVRLGASDFLLPRSSLLEFTALSGYYVNASRFAGCREFRTESAVRFEEPPAVRAPESNKPVTGEPLPRGLPVVLAFEAEIDTSRAAAGDAVTARTRTDIVEDRSKRVLAAAGSIVRGRILRMERQFATPAVFLISIRFETLEAGNRSIPFAAVLDPKVYLQQFTVSLADLANGVPPRRSSRNITAGRTLVFESDRSGYIVPRGFESSWVTSDRSLK